MDHVVPWETLCCPWRKCNLSVQAFKTQQGLPRRIVVKNLLVNAREVGDMDEIPGSERFPGEGNGTNSSILAWRIPWTEEPGGLQSRGSQRVGYDCMTEHGIVHRRPNTIRPYPRCPLAHLSCHPDQSANPQMWQAHSHLRAGALACDSFPLHSPGLAPFVGLNSA